MASNSNRRSGSSGRSTSRKRVHLSTPDRRVSDRQGKPKVEGAGRGERGRPLPPHVREKREVRERRAVQRRRRLQLRAGGVLLLVVLVVAGWLYLRGSSAFHIREVEVTGNRRLTAEQVRRIASVPTDATLLRFPADDVEKRLESSPWISSVTLSRDFPDRLRIRVVERVPAALLDLGKTIWVVDGAGFVLERFASDAPSQLVVVRRVSGAQPKVGRRMDSDALRNALRVVAGLSPELRSVVRSVSAPSVDETSLITQDGVEILFGTAEQVAKKDLIAREIMSEQRGKVVFIDVRTTERPVWRGLGK